MEEDIRWKQRFINLQKAFNLLKEAVEVYPNLSVIEQEGMVQRFEYTFELAWKTLKDFLEYQNMQTNFPREVIKLAFQSNIIINGEIWLQMLENRNIIAHTYNEENFNKITNAIANVYFMEIQKLVEWLKQQ